MSDVSQPEEPISLKDIKTFWVTATSFEDYKRTFSLDPNTLKPNARVLDLGSGTHQEFAKGLKEVRPDVYVVSVDPTLGLATDEKALKEKGVDYIISEDESISTELAQEEARKKRLEDKAENAVAAEVPQLSFKQGSFDYIFENHGVFTQLPPEDQEKHVREILRIVAPEGVINIYPLDESAHSNTNQERLTDGELIERSRSKLEELMKKIECKRYELFEADDPLPTKGMHRRRAGVRIFK